jgi:hypothetical protein
MAEMPVRQKSQGAKGLGLQRRERGRSSALTGVFAGVVPGFGVMEWRDAAKGGRSSALAGVFARVALGWRGRRCDVERPSCPKRIFMPSVNCEGGEREESCQA